MMRLGLLVSGLVLFSSPAWASKVDKLAKECEAGKAESCQKLLEIAKDAKETWDVRAAAVKEIADQAILADVAKNDNNPAVRMVAAGKLTDQAPLADIAKNDSNPFMRKAAVKNPNLTDQALLADVARKDDSDSVRAAAIEKLTDPAVLADVAKNDDSDTLRAAAIEKLTDPAVLADVAKNAKPNNTPGVVARRLARRGLAVTVATTKGKVEHSFEQNAPRLKLATGETPVVLFKLPDYTTPYWLRITSLVLPGFVNTIFVPSVVFLDADFQPTKELNGDAFAAKNPSWSEPFRLEAEVAMDDARKDDRYALVFTKRESLESGQGEVRWGIGPASTVKGSLDGRLELEVKAQPKNGE